MKIKVCSTTGKVRYSTRMDAKISLAEVNASANSKREESRIYRCTECNGWHLTSRK